MTDAVRVAARKLIAARQMSRDLSPGDNAQPYLAGRIEEALNELSDALAVETPGRALRLVGEATPVLRCTCGEFWDGDGHESTCALFEGW